MEKIRFVTSMNETLYKEYGERALDEFEQYAGDGIDLLVIYEDNLEGLEKNYKKITFKNFSHSKRELFIKRFAHLKEANGIVLNFRKDSEGNKYANINHDFRFNAVRFSHKLFAIYEASNLLKGSRYLVWIDADIRVLKAFDNVSLLPFLPNENQIMAYLGRTHFPRPNPYSEGGWYAFNQQHNLFDSFLDTIINYYINGDVFTLKEWHDCWIVDTCREIFEKNGCLFKNISGNASHLEHPFINSGLGEIFDHLKGPMRKQNGRSFSKDYKNEVCKT